MSPAQALHPKQIALAATALCVMLLTSPASGQISKEIESPKPASADKESALVGWVISADPVSKKLIIRREGGVEGVFRINDKTQIKSSPSKTVSFAEIKVGTQVGIRYSNLKDGVPLIAALRIDGELPPPEPIVWPPRRPSTPTPPPKQ